MIKIFKLIRKSYFRAYGQEILPDLISRINAAIENLKNQPEESEKYGNLDTGILLPFFIVAFFTI
jgi:hypothetical protein